MKPEEFKRIMEDFTAPRKVADYLLVEEEDANNLDWATALDREARDV